MKMIKGDAVKIVDSEETKKLLLKEGWKEDKPAPAKKEINGKTYKKGK